MPDFTHSSIDFERLKERAYNYRWAELPEGVIPLTAADPDFSAPPAISEAISRYVARGPLAYGPALGLPSFREAVAEDLIKGGVEARASQVIATDGAASAMFLTARALLEPGDEALIFDPVDFLFERSVSSAGAHALRVPFDRQLGLDLAELERLASRPQVKMICLCAPHNPYGRLLRDEELREVGRIARERGLWVLSDEVWLKLRYERAQAHSAAFEGLSERTFTVSGFSKAYGLAGLRVGYVHAPTQAGLERLTQASHAGDTAFGASTLSQVAAVAGLRDCEAWLEAWLGHLHEARALLCGRLDRLEGLRCELPEATYLASPEIDYDQASMSGFDSASLAAFIMDRAQVGVVPGSPAFFGARAEGLIRFSFATSLELLSEALDRIEAVWGERAAWLAQRQASSAQLTNSAISRG